MPTYYRMNPFYEFDIMDIQHKYSSPPYLQALADAFPYFFLLISQPEDCVDLSNVNEELIEIWQSWQIQFGDAVQQVPDHNLYSLFEWGQFHTLSKDGLKIDQQRVQELRTLNSKFFQSQWKNLWNTCRSQVLMDPHDYRGDFPVYIRKEFGFSGRGGVVVHSPQDYSKYCKKNTEYLMEPYLAQYKETDHSELLERKEDHICQIGSTEMLIGRKNQFLGCILQNKKKDIYASLLKKQLQKIDASYNGPIAVDYFYFLKDRLPGVHFCEANFRYSLGRLLHDIYSKLTEHLPVCGLFFLQSNRKISLSEIAKRGFLPLHPIIDYGHTSQVWIFSHNLSRNALLETIKNWRQLGEET